MDRRRFIQSAARGGLAATLASIAGILVRRDQVDAGGACTGDYRCRACAGFSGCSLPEAVRIRETQQANNG